MADILGLKKLTKQLDALAKEATTQAKSHVIVGYTASYALYVHENIEMKLKGKLRPKGRGKFWDPQGRGQAKFLEEPARRLTPELGKIVAQVTKETHDLRQGLLAAGLRLQRESQRVCPVDTGNLKNSAFTRLEGQG